MEPTEIMKLIALPLQFIGILVGTSTIFELVLKRPPIKALFTSFNFSYHFIESLRIMKLFKKAKFPSFVREYDTSDNVDDLYKNFNSPVLVVVFLLTNIAPVIFTLGIYVLIILQIIYGFLSSTLFWIILSIWLVLLVDFYIRAVFIRYKLEKANIVKVRRVKNLPFRLDWFIQFLCKWFTHPLSYIKITIALLIMTILLLPSIIMRPFYPLQLDNQSARQKYYIIYATTALLLSTTIQIFTIFI